MTIQELLDDFAKYSKYDPDQTEFMLGSDTYEFNKTGNDIGYLLKNGYDQTGVLSVLLAQDAFLRICSRTKFTVVEWLTDPKSKDEMKNYQQMWNKFQDKDILAEEDLYLQTINDVFEKAMGIQMIGQRNAAQEKQALLQSTVRVLEDIKSIHSDIYKKCGSVSNITQFTTHILVFERMADCLLSIENSPDAMYLCYINQYGTADGYFAFVIKSAGNLFALHDRIDEAYIGAHQGERNGSWSNAHLYKLFPYDYIFNYANHDYKGYASTFIINEEKLDFLTLGAEVYQPLLIAMLILKSKYEGKELEGNIKKLNSLFEENYLLEHENDKAEISLAILKKNELFVQNNKYVCGLDMEKAITDRGYNEEFDICDAGLSLASEYGNGFKANVDGTLSTIAENNVGGKAFYSEFIGDANRLDKEVYRNIRKQLAEYISEVMKKEYEDFGGWKGMFDYWYAELRKNQPQTKRIIIDAICSRMYHLAHPEFVDKWASYSIIKREEASGYVSEFFNASTITKTLGGTVVDYAIDDETGTRCKEYYWFTFRSCNELETFLGNELPHVFKTYGVEGKCNGNSILDATDAVGDLKSPFEQERGTRNNFSVRYGFSTRGFRIVYDKWLLEHGFIEEMEKRKAEQKAKRAVAKAERLEDAAQYALLGSKPYDSHHRFDKYDKKKELEELESNVQKLFPGLEINILTHEEKSGAGKIRTTRAYITIPVAGNAEKILELQKLGWWVAESHRMPGRMVKKLMYAL